MNYPTLIEHIQSLHPKFQYFHLVKCLGCGSPSYCEPCRICKFYNPYDDSYRSLEDELKRCESYVRNETKNMFIKSVNIHKNISAWYISGYFDTCLFKPIPYVTKLTEQDYQLRDEIQILYNQELNITIYPSLEQIWKWIVEENKYEEYTKKKYDAWNN